ncbi:MAG TPA: FGLLP motif-containing membrane protein, partial [Acidimicrobiia bacterium]|nr:FGLLP motif-containing membrane protein [Acidimicrobiia bacterium]
DPLVVAASVALTAGMLFLIPFPAEIFNNTLAEHHDQIRAWFRRRRERPPSTFWERPGGVVLALLVITLLYGFLDPGFGFNPTSLPTFVGLLVGVLITTLGFALPAMILRRFGGRGWGRWRALPIALLVGVGCVVLSRLIGFLPGYLYGMVLALVFAGEVDEKAEANEVIVTALVLLGLAFAAWFGLGAVRASETSTLSETIEAGLAMTTVAAFEGLVFGLLPIHGMPGRILFKSRRWQWAVIWGLALLAFFHVLVNPQSGYLVDTAVVPVATTYALLALFSLISVVLWAWFRPRPTRSG